MASKRRNRKLSLPKNWRLVKKTRKNGEVFYNAQRKVAFFGLLWGVDIFEEDDDDVNDKEKVINYIKKQITKHAADYDKQCGKEIAKKEYINFDK